MEELLHDISQLMVKHKSEIAIKLAEISNANGFVLK